MVDIEDVLAGLDPATARQVRHVLSSLLPTWDLTKLNQLAVQQFLWRALPRLCPDDPHEQHEIAWSLGDFLQAAGQPRYAALCRDRRTHELLASWAKDPSTGARAAESLARESGVEPPDTGLLTFSREPQGREAEVHAELSRMLERAVAEGRLDVTGEEGQRRRQALAEAFLATPSSRYGGWTPREVVLRNRALLWVRGVDPEVSNFWGRAFRRLAEEPAVPANVELSISPAQALLDAASTGTPLTDDGQLAASVVDDLDARFGWSDKLPLGGASPRRPATEQDVPALMFVDNHLRAQGLIAPSRGRLTLTDPGRRCRTDPPKLWRALVRPAPRWEEGFDQDALAMMAVVLLLRRTAVSASSLTNQVASLLSHKWRSREADSLQSGIEWLRVEWYRLGVGLSWWELSRRADDYRLSEFGRVAASELFWSVAARPRD